MKTADEIIDEYCQETNLIIGASRSAIKRFVEWQIKKEQEEERKIVCEFRECQKDAIYEGWYRTLDFAGQPTGLIQKMQTCEEHVKFLIGYSSPS